MPPRPAATAGHFVLSLDGHLVALQDVDGGHIRGEVVTTDMGPQRVATKSISTLTFEPFTLSVGLSMGAPLVDWIKSSFDLSGARKDGSVVTVDAASKSQGSRHFRDAMISEITIPAMDGSSKDAAFFTIRLQPEGITYAKGDGAIVRPPVNARQKHWLASNFRITIGNLPCSRVATIDAFTIKQRVDDAPGRRRPMAKVPTRIEFPNLKVTFSAVDAGPWENWFETFVIDGSNGPEHELPGAIEFIDVSTQATLGSIALSQVGIFSLRPERHDASQDPVSRYVAELYVGQMAFDIQAVR